MKRTKRSLVDRKNWFIYLFWSLVNKIIIWVRFKDFQIIGKENLPTDGPFLLVSNHISRWDGLIVYRTINRPANFMVSPNELMGTQGQVLLSMGSFPADPKADIIEFAQKQMGKGEGVVIFPEGNIFKDGVTHKFKNGAARVVLGLLAAGVKVPLVPCAVNYAQDGKVAQLALGQAIDPGVYMSDYESNQGKALCDLSERMYREVCHLRHELGCLGDTLALFHSGSRHWSQFLAKVAPSLSRPALVAQQSDCARVLAISCEDERLAS